MSRNLGTYHLLQGSFYFNSKFFRFTGMLQNEASTADMLRRAVVPTTLNNP